MLLWTMIPVTLALIVVQEMCARMGVVTGKGLSDLIREEFGLRITFIMMILLVIVNFGNVMAEFSGIAGSMQLFHISKYISVPICAALVWLLVVKGDYKGVEKVFLVASAFYIAYIFARVFLPPQPGIRGAGHRQASSPLRHGTISGLRLYDGGCHWHDHLAVDAVLYAVFRGGKRNRSEATGGFAADVIVGSFFTDIVGWFIIVACAATLFVHGMAHDPGASRRCGGDEAAGGPIRIYPVCRGSVQCVVCLRPRFCRFPPHIPLRRHGI